MLMKDKENTSRDHGRVPERDNSANWLISTFLGRNMTILEATCFAVLKRKYLHKYMTELQWGEEEEETIHTKNTMLQTQIRNLKE